MPLGVIVAGDFALATGADRHLPFLTRELAADAGGARVAWAWFVAADPVAIAAALNEAWLRPHRVVCFGGLGAGSDDHVRAAVAALQAGRVEVGLPAQAADAVDGALSCGNITCFPGHPEQAHPRFRQWWRALAQGGSGATAATETLPWPLPETDARQSARLTVARAHPGVRQHIGATADGAPRLVFTAASRGKAQAARKALQRLLGGAA